MQTKIQIANDKIHITAPFSEENNLKWRELGGKFTSGQWIIPDNTTSRQAIADLYGTKSDEVEALVPYDKIELFGKIAQIGGYVLASRRGRDYRVEMPEGVSLAQGKFRSSGGSVKNPSVSLDSDVVFRLRCRSSFAASRGLELAINSAPEIEV